MEIRDRIAISSFAALTAASLTLNIMMVAGVALPTIATAGLSIAFYSPLLIPALFILKELPNSSEKLKGIAGAIALVVVTAIFIGGTAYGSFHPNGAAIGEYMIKATICLQAFILLVGIPVVCELTKPDKKGVDHGN